MRSNYCYWSVCDGSYGAMMERCVRSARNAGVFKEFHVLCDRPLEGCECYDSFQCDKTGGMFKLHYLKVGMNKLNFDYFVWIDADSIFIKNPMDLLCVLGRSPIHVPLEFDLSVINEECQWFGRQCLQSRDLFRRAGVLNRPYFSRSAFWIVSRDVIDHVYELAFRFWNLGKESKIAVNVDTALGYAMQMLCGNPEAHLTAGHPEIWASDDLGHFCPGLSNSEQWPFLPPAAEQAVVVRPSILHVPLTKQTLEPATVPL